MQGKCTYVCIEARAAEGDPLRPTTQELSLKGLPGD